MVYNPPLGQHCLFLLSKKHSQIIYTQTSKECNKNLKQIKLEINSNNPKVGDNYNSNGITYKCTILWNKLVEGEIFCK